MRLLPKKEVESKIRKERDQLLEESVRLRRYYRETKSKLSTIKDDYSKDRLERLDEFERFAAAILEKKGKLLKELSDTNEEIKKRQDVYYGLVEKQDELDDREYKLKERERKLDDREEFIRQLEVKVPIVTGKP